MNLKMRMDEVYPKHCGIIKDANFEANFHFLIPFFYSVGLYTALFSSRKVAG